MSEASPHFVSCIADVCVHDALVKVSTGKVANEILTQELLAFNGFSFASSNRMLKLVIGLIGADRTGHSGAVANPHECAVTA